MSVIDISKRFNTETGQNIEYKNPLLEEYVDCLHFILSIGLDIEIDPKQLEISNATADDIIVRFISLQEYIIDLFNTPDGYEYEMLLNAFLGLGQMLGFTYEQIEKSYCDKNEVNHQRQITGY